WIEQTPSNEPSSSPAGAWILLRDDPHAAAALKQALTDRGLDSVICSRANTFAASEDRITIDPENAEHVDRLFEYVSAERRGCAGIVHAWALDSFDDTDVAGGSAGLCDSVLALLKGLAKRSDSRSATIRVVTRQAAGVIPTE